MHLTSCSFRGICFSLGVLLVFAGSLSNLAAQDSPGAVDPALPVPDAPPYERLLTGEDLERAEELERRISQFRQEGRNDEALPPAEEVLELRRRVLGDDHEGTVGGLADLSRILQNLGRYDKAEKSIREAVETARRALGPGNPKTFEVLDQWAQFLRARNRSTEAEPVFQEVLDGRRLLFGNDHPLVPLSHFNLASLYHATGKMSDAEFHYNEALELYRRQNGKDHSYTLSTLIIRAHVLVSLGRLTEALQSYREGLEGMRKLYGDNNPNTAMALNGMGYCLRALGRLSEAEAYFRQALAGCRAHYGDDHLNTLTAMLNVGHALEAQWRLPEAEPLLRRALAGYRALYGDDHPRTLLGLHNMAHLLESQGHLEEAEAAFLATLEGRRQVLGPDHPRTLTVLSNLGLLAKKRGRPEDAETLLRQAMAERRRVLGDENPHTLTSIDNLGVLLMEQGRLDEAEPLLREALKSRQTVLGENHPRTLLSLQNLGRLLELRGQADQAEQMIRDALDGLRRVYGEAHANVTDSMILLAELYYRKGDLVRATAAWTEAAGSFEAARLRSGARGLERVHFAAGHSPLAPLAACLARSGKAVQAWERFEASLARGLLDTISSRQARPLSRDERQRESDLISQLSKLDERLGRMYGMADSEADDEQEAAAGEKLRSERDGLLEALASFQSEISGKYGAAAGEVCSLGRIQSRIPAGTAVLGWVDFEPGPTVEKVPGEHWACLIRQSGKPVWVALPGSGTEGSWTDADSAVTGQLRQSLGKRARRSVDRRRLARVQQRVRTQRIEPLAPYLDGISNLVVLPAGKMAGIPVEVLTDDYTVSYAPSGTMFAWLREKRGSTEGRWAVDTPPLLALGDPVFSSTGQSAILAHARGTRGAEKMAGDGINSFAGGEAPTAESRPSGGGEEMHDRSSVPVNGEEPSSERKAEGGEDRQASVEAADTPTRAAPAPGPERRTRFRSLDPLPGTRREVEAIAELFHPAVGQPGPVVLLGSAASEQRLEALSESGQLGTFRYIHLATHGVMDDQVAMRSALILSQDQLGDSFERVLEGKGVFDGWLTGEQIVRSWKLNADLVTLSGCETALGQEAGGEGYLGFSQALFVAGTRSLVLSLWKVDDRATMLLMRRFYENLLGRFTSARSLPHAEYEPGLPLPRAEALREAKSWLRSLTADQVRELDPAGNREGARGPDSGQSEPAGELSGLPYQDPRYWAAFILLGDPQ